MKKQELKQSVEDSFKRDPILFTGALSALLLGVSKMIQANNERKNAKTYRMETKRRMQNQK